MDFSDQCLIMLPYVQALAAKYGAEVMPDMPTYKPKTAYFSTQIALDPSIFAAAAALPCIFLACMSRTTTIYNGGSCLQAASHISPAGEKVTQQEV
ncbi:MAG: hypothetical protein ACLQVN_19675 [Bryobacteraceae bacterium]